MNLIAIKMLIGDRLKYLSLVAGLASAALLVTQQAAIFTGYARQTGAWIRDVSAADLWVTDEQVEFSEDLKPMLDTTLSRVRGIDGVAWAIPMYKGYLTATLPDGTRKTVRIIGLDDATLIGGPPHITQGALSDLRRDRAVMIHADDPTDKLAMTRDRTRKALGVGDRFSVNDNEVEIVGTYRSTPEFFWEPILYTTYSRAVFLAPRERKTLTYIWVKARDGVNVNDVARRIEAVTGLKARTNVQFEKETMHWILNKTGILVNFGITIALGFVIGVLAAGQTLFQFMLDNTRHFAAIKAMGASNLRIAAMVIVQVLVVGSIGYCIGLGGAAVSGVLFKRGGLAFEMPWQIPLFAAGAILLCCILASVLSIARVLRLEPAVVFK